MSQVRNASPDDKLLLRSLFDPIAVELADVDDLLQSELQHPNEFIDELARHSFRIGGKRLRPALLLLTAKACGAINAEHRTLAAVVEMIHTATLVHDDVLDEADIRRHIDTVNARWNNQTSVLLGDYLFTHAFYMASTLDSTFACQTIGRATNAVCEGELMQTASSGDFWLSREAYFEIVRAKTAELCACCCLLGAHYAGAGDSIAAELEQFGRCLGIAFQIADDLLDVEGDENATGKSLGTDLLKRKMTLPLILLRDQLPEPDQQALRQLFESKAVETNGLLCEWLDSAGVLQQAREAAADYSEKAAKHLAGLGECSSKRVLSHLCKFVVDRGV